MTVCKECYGAGCPMCEEPRRFRVNEDGEDELIEEDDEGPDWDNIRDERNEQRRS